MQHGRGEREPGGQHRPGADPLQPLAVPARRGQVLKPQGRQGEDERPRPERRTPGHAHGDALDGQQDAGGTGGRVADDDAGPPGPARLRGPLGPGWPAARHRRPGEPPVRQRQGQVHGRGDDDQRCRGTGFERHGVRAAGQVRGQAVAGERARGGEGAGRDLPLRRPLARADQHGGGDRREHDQHGADALQVGERHPDRHQQRDRDQRDRSGRQQHARHHPPGRRRLRCGPARSGRPRQAGNCRLRGHWHFAWPGRRGRPGHRARAGMAAPGGAWLAAGAAVIRPSSMRTTRSAASATALSWVTSRIV